MLYLIFLLALCATTSAGAPRISLSDLTIQSPYRAADEHSLRSDNAAYSCHLIARTEFPSGRIGLPPLVPFGAPAGGRCGLASPFYGSPGSNSTRRDETIEAALSMSQVNPAESSGLMSA